MRDGDRKRESRYRENERKVIDWERKRERLFCEDKRKERKLKIECF